MKKIRFDPKVSHDFSILGISIPIRDYKLCFLLNRQLKARFSKTGKIIDSTKNFREIDCHYYSNPDNGDRFYLVKNKLEDGFILPQFKQADYFVIVFSKNNAASVADFKKALNQVPDIQSSFAIPNDQLSHIDVE